VILKLKIFIKFAICFLIELFIRSSKDIKPNSLLIIRLDAIGDYILFRNFIEIIKTSAKYKDYKITVIGNVVWKSIAEELDSEFVDKFIWLDRTKFKKNYLYRYKKLQQIASCGYEVVLSPTYSRDFFMEDSIVKVLTVKEKIGSTGDTSNATKWQKNISDKYYDNLIDARDGILFEFNRNKEFFENLLETKLIIEKPNIVLKDKNISFNIPKLYALLFIGSNDSYRKWSIEKFADIAKYLKQRYDYDIVLCGATSDIKEAKIFAECFDENYDLVGRTSLLELLAVIKHADIMVSNETSAPHMAVGLNIPHIFVISNANHFGRFTPYPEDMTKNYHAIYHPKIKKDLNDYEKLCNIYGEGSSLDINDIDIASVKNTIDKVLNG
jgi:ADP-heptose:LPS heptosyltransferase